MLTQEQYDAFLEDLKSVYEKHGLYVDSCGCCAPIVCEMDGMAGDRATEDYTTEIGECCRCDLRP